MREELKIRLEEFKTAHRADSAVQGRIRKPPVEFIGEEILEQAVSALLQGENILLYEEQAALRTIIIGGSVWA